MLYIVDRAHICHEYHELYSWKKYVTNMTTLTNRTTMTTPTDQKIYKDKRRIRIVYFVLSFIWCPAWLKMRPVLPYSCSKFQENIKIYNILIIYVIFFISGPAWLEMRPVLPYSWSQYQEKDHFTRQNLKQEYLLPILPYNCSQYQGKIYTTSRKIHFWPLKDVTFQSTASTNDFHTKWKFLPTISFLQILYIFVVCHIFV